MSIPLDQLVCPISKELPVDPVLAQDGYIYERACIQKHLTNRNTSPMTNSPMESFVGARHITNLLQDCIDSGYENTLLDDWARAVANRTETPPHDNWNKVVHKFDKIVFFENDFLHEDITLMRMEFAATHSQHGEIYFYEKDKWATEQIRYFNHQCIIFNTIVRHLTENTQALRREYATTDPKHGQIQYFENGEVDMRIEYAATHPKHGEIHFYEKNKFVRREYTPNHPQHGEINFYKRDTLVRTEWHRKFRWTLTEAAEILKHELGHEGFECLPDKTVIKQAAEQLLIQDDSKPIMDLAQQCLRELKSDRPKKRFRFRANMVITDPGAD